MQSHKKIFVAGHNGMVGQAIVRQLESDHTCTVLTEHRDKLDLTNQQEVDNYFSNHQIHEVYLAAARVGGIHANNNYPALFSYENMMIQSNVIHAAWRANVSRLLFLGSSCIYPRLAKQPIKEESLMSGYLEPTNEPYAIAKIAGIKLCESYNRQYGTDYRSVMPTNLYGPNDNFHPIDSHVLPALLKRIHEAMMNKAGSVTIWGTGNPLREFLYVDDMASACIHLMRQQKDYWKDIDPMCSHINIGSGEECSIAELARSIAEIVDYKGEIVFDNSKPDGTPRKLLDSTKLLNSGWRPKFKLTKGIQLTYEWYKENIGNARYN